MMNTLKLLANIFATLLISRTIVVVFAALKFRDNIIPRHQFTTLDYDKLMHSYNVSAKLKNMTIYMIGNSVTRHYSFSILSVLDGSDRDTSIDRKIEKKKCQGVLAVDSCDHFSVETNVSISFMWKNFIDVSNASYILDQRDICSHLNDSSTRDCLDYILQNATSRDLLLVGSFPTAVQIAGPSFSTFKKIFWEIYSSEKTKIKSVSKTMELVFDSFPGLVVWMSYPFVSVKSVVEEGDVVDLIEKLNALNMYSFRAIGKNKKPRAAFLDLFSLQREHEDSYADFIHHPGNLSLMIANTVLRMVE